MLTSIEVMNPQGSLLALPMEDVSDGVVVKDIQGLDPVKATLVSSSFAQMNGEQYHSSRREARNIVLKLDLEPDYITTTVKDLRDRLYRYFMPRSQIFMKFYDSSGLEVSIEGRVESFDCPLFVQEPEANISIMSFDPDFLGATPVVIQEETTEDEDEIFIEYEGSIETGIEFVLNVDRSLSEFTIYHRLPDGSIRTTDFSAPLENGDVLTIVTIRGSKRVTLNRSSIESSALYGISPQSNWLELVPGDNYIRVYAEGEGIPYTITYTNRYGGL